MKGWAKIVRGLAVDAKELVSPTAIIAEGALAKRMTLSIFAGISARAAADAVAEGSPQAAATMELARIAAAAAAAAGEAAETAVRNADVAARSARNAEALVDEMEKVEAEADRTQGVIKAARAASLAAAAAEVSAALEVSGSRNGMGVPIHVCA